MTSGPTEQGGFGRKQYQECLPRLNLGFNTRVFIKLSTLHSSVPLQGEFIGASHYEFLILRLPSVPGLLQKLIPRSLVDIRYQFQGAESHFSSEIISYTAKPSMLLFVTYPERVSIQESRRHERLFCLLPTRLATPYGEALGVMKDLSMGGCRIIMEMTGQSNIRKIVDGDKVVLNSFFANALEPVRGIGLVRNIDISGSKISIGMSFDKGSKEFASALADYLALIKAPV